MNIKYCPHCKQGMSKVPGMIRSRKKFIKAWNKSPAAVTWMKPATARSRASFFRRMGYKVKQYVGFRLGIGNQAARKFVIKDSLDLHEYLKSA